LDASADTDASASTVQSKCCRIIHGTEGMSGYLFGLFTELLESRYELIPQFSEIISPIMSFLSDNPRRHSSKRPYG
jgi:hypothetical protein